MKNINKFDRPIIILSSPRAGSTLLFEIMTNCKNLWSIGDESHKAFESIPSLRIKNNALSNRLDKNDVNDEVIALLKQNFYSELRDRDNVRPDINGLGSFRFLEKTPKNALRVSFLDEVFPDAFFIYLVRDPCENISSIMDAWKTGRWITYNDARHPKLPGMKESWSMLLPPDWQSVKNKPLEKIAAFQWMSSNQHIINDLKKISSERWTTISYSELVTEPKKQMQRLCQFCDIEFDEVINSVTENVLPASKYTLSKPSSDKWKKNENEIANTFPSLKNTISEIDGLLKISRESDISWVFNKPVRPVSRNAECPCGSGKKYKRCHGGH